MNNELNSATQAQAAIPAVRFKVDYKADTERGWIEVIGEEVTFAGVTDHRFAVHNSVNTLGEYTVSHIETGFAVGHAETPEYAIELATKRWTTCDPESLSLKLIRARNATKVGAQRINPERRLTIYEVQRNAAEAAISAELESLGLTEAAAPPSPQPVAESVALDALRAVCRLLDGGQPKDAAGALMVAQSALSGKPAAWLYDMTPPQGFLDYVRANYSGTVEFHDPAWHAQRLWNSAMRNAKPPFVNLDSPTAADAGGLSAALVAARNALSAVVEVMRQEAPIDGESEQEQALKVVCAALAARPPAVMSDRLSPTDLSKRLREYAASSPRHQQTLIATRDLIAACDEIDRYYTGMRNWKATAEAKDRQPAMGAGSLSDEQITRIAGDVKQRNAGVWPGEVAFVRAMEAAQRATPAIEPVAGLTDAEIIAAVEEYNSGQANPSGNYIFRRKRIIEMVRHLTGNAGDQKGGA